MNWKQIDRQFKRELSTYESDVNTDDLWASIAPELEDWKKRRGFLLWWWYGSGVLLLTSVVFGMVYYQPFGTQLPIDHLQASVLDCMEVALQEEICPPTTEPLGIVVVEQTSAPITILRPSISQKNTTNNALQIEQLTPQNSKIASASNNAIQEQKTEQQTSQEAKPVDASPFSKRVVLTPITSLTRGITLLDMEEIPPSFSSFETPISVANKTPQFQFAISTTVGLFRAQQQYTANTPTATAYVAQRESTERPLEAISTGISTEIKHQSGIYFSTGISYTRINDLFQYERIDTIRRTSHAVMANLRTVGRSLSITETETSATSEKLELRVFNKRTYNAVQLIEVPFLIGYEAQVRNLYLRAEAGLLYNIQTHVDGNILAESGAILDLKRAAIHPTQIALGYQAGLQIHYRIHHNWRVYTGSTFKQYPNVLVTDQALSLKRSLFGLQLGVRYQLH